MRCRLITARSLALHSGMAVLGGLAYMGIELLWRGRTHWTMGVLGGVCFVLIGLLDEIQEHPPLPLQMLQGAAIVTGLELAVAAMAAAITIRWSLAPSTVPPVMAPP